MGLFMGVLILSIVEILYYFTVNLISRLSKKKAEPNNSDLGKVNYGKGKEYKNV